MKTPRHWTRHPLVRHVRYLWLCACVYRYAEECARYGLGLGVGVPSQSDLEALEAVWRGEA